ncbi:tetratricopeptide repeat protein [Fibrobacter sp. UWP2]|uniref:tetratricopeptide repeat protein n=1 Tax=Fibrobacter sp. UWP2 TaxID=1896216 RepID=UPI0009351476|nr:tetratricopeptide repeat protein [Fibrobacter sp. UWP2]
MMRRVCNQTHHLYGYVWKIVVVVATVFFCGCSETEVNRGNAALQIGDYDRAVTSFSKALDSDPAHRDARYGLALAYYAIAEDKEHLKTSTLDLWDRTVKEFRILSKVDSSGKIDAAYSTSLFYLARATLMENGRANVLPLLDHSIQLDSANYFSHNLKAFVLSNRGDVEQAKKIYIYIVTKEPNFASAYMNLGNLYWAEGDIEQAWDIWSMGHEALPDDKELARWTQAAEDSLKAMVEQGEL